MATITAAGIGSGLDVNNILEQIVAAEREPTERRLDVKETNLQSELSAFGLLNGSLSTFQSSLGKLTTASSFSSSDVVVSNTDILSASSSGVAQAGDYTVEVKTLAKAHALASIAFTALDDVLGAGTLNFSFGTTSYDGAGSYTGFTQNTERSDESVVIDNTNNTITGVRDAINEANIGVTATVVDDGAGFRLLISSDQAGVDNSLEIRVDESAVGGDDTDNSGLSILAYNSVVRNNTQTQQADDAEVTINGLTVTRESNTISGAISGVTLNLKTTDVGNPVQINVLNKNVETAEVNIAEFVNGFNEVATVLNGLTKFGGEDGTDGILLGDSTARNVLQQIRRGLGSVIENGGAFNSLSSIGITTKRDGLLELDTNALTSALNTDFESVSQLFYASGSSTVDSVLFTSSTSNTQEGNYQISISQVATQGRFQSAPISGPIVIDGNNDRFSIEVDDVPTGFVTLTQGSYSDLTTLAQEIENKINAASTLQNASVGVSVAYANGAFDVSSNTYGATSSVSLVFENNDLGFNDSGSSTTGVDVSGTIGGQQATGSGRFLTGVGSTAGLVLEITGSTTGGLGQVDFSRGIASKLDSLLTQLQADKGLITAKTEGLNEQISDISEERVNLTERVDTLEARFRAQFAALDLLVSRLNTTSDFLQQQLDALPGFTRKNN